MSESRASGDSSRRDTPLARDTDAPRAPWSPSSGSLLPGGMTPSGGPSSTNPSPASAASAAAAPDSQNQQGARRRRRPGGFMLVVAAGVAAGVALTVKQMSATKDISKLLSAIKDMSKKLDSLEGRLDSLERSALRLPWPRRELTHVSGCSA